MAARDAGAGEREFRVFAGAAGGRLLLTATLLTGESPRNRPVARRLLTEALARTYTVWARVSGEGDDPYDRARAELVRGFLRALRLRRVLGAAKDAGIGGPLGALRPLARAALVLRLHEGIDTERTAMLLGCGTGRVETLTAGAARRFAAGAGPQCEAEARRVLGALPVPVVPAGLADAAVEAGLRLRRARAWRRALVAAAFLTGAGAAVAAATGLWG
ncbi:hypothetical protein [Streptomyces sp. NPDC002644]